MKVLVTGGTGFLGRHVVWRVAAEGAEVTFTGRNAQAANTVIQEAAAPVQWLSLSHGTPQAEKLLLEAAHGANAVVHCAALSAPWGPFVEFVRANVASTAEVIAACKANGIHRLVHISTPSLYFDFSDRLDILEEDVLPAPANDYVRTKQAAEQLVRSAGLPEVAILRPRAIFGPWDYTLVPRLLRVMAKGHIPLVRGGNIRMDLTYVANAVEAVWLALTRPLPRALNIYNVTNDEPRSMAELLQVLAREFEIPLRTMPVPWPLLREVARAMELKARWCGGAEPLFTRYSAGVLAFSQTLDVSSLRRDLGWRARVGIDEGIHLHAQWWRDQHS